MAEEEQSSPSEPKPKLREFPSSQGIKFFQDTFKEYPPPPEDDTNAVADTSPLVRMCNAIVVAAIEEGADEVRIEPSQRSVYVRVHIDGIWKYLMSIPKHVQAPITNRYKVMADIPFWKKTVQTGSIPVKYGPDDYNLIVSTFPALHGDVLSIRLVPKWLVPSRPEGLAWVSFYEIADMVGPGKILPLIGPRGSGKTTLGMVLLNRHNAVDRSIATIEEQRGPEIAGVLQSYRNPARQVTAMDLARMHIRSGVDTVYIDAINDADSAEAAFTLAENGIAVIGGLSTLNIDTMPVLFQKWGISPARINAAVSECVQIRLIRRICPACREEYAPKSNDKSWLAHLGLPFEDKLYRGRGCEECDNTGYKGRTGIYTLHTLTQRMNKELLHAAAAEKIQEGTTTLEEAVRLVG